MQRSVSTPSIHGPWLASLLAALILSGCVSDGDEQLFEETRLVPGPGAVEFDPRGGVLRSQDGRVALVVAAGALEDTIGVTIDPLAEPLDGVVGSAYRIEPAALAFGQPASIEVRVDARAFDVATLNDLRVAVLDDLGEWVPLAEPVVDSTTATVRASTSSLGTFAVVALGCANDDACDEGELCARDATCRLPTCVGTQDCEAQQVCVDGRCASTTSCDAPDACAPEQSCTPDGLCAPRPRCEVVHDCGDDAECDAGQCVRLVECLANDDCSTDERCDAGLCVVANALCSGEACECASDTDCVAGEVCVDGQCQGQRMCEADADCVAGRVCTDGLCQAP